MIKPRRGRTVLLGVGIMAVFFLLISGCAGLESKKGGPSTRAAREKDKGPTPIYYEFGDVLIPSELELVKKSSFVFQTPGFSAGVLSLKGRIEISSLISFFENNMAKDNWRPVSSFKSTRTIMLFKKENRWCIISITEDYNTYVEVWVAPTINEAEFGLLK